MLTASQRGWILLIYVAMMLIVIGWQGNLGKTVAILFCPKYITLDEGSGTNGS
jgi:hypothetical protein